MWGFRANTSSVTPYPPIVPPFPYGFLVPPSPHTDPHHCAPTQGAHDTSIAGRLNAALAAGRSQNTLVLGDASRSAPRSLLKDAKRFAYAKWPSAILDKRLRLDNNQ